MRLWIIFFVAGVSSVQLFQRFLPLKYSLLFLIIFIITQIYSHFLKNGLSKKACQLFCAAGLGFMWMMIAVYGQLAYPLPSALENKKIIVIGRIASIPEFKNQNLRFQMDIEHCQTESTKLPKLFPIKLNWYPGNSLKLPRVGERWQLVVKLKKPHGFHNPGSFNYEKSLLAHQIRATGYVINHRDNLCIAPPGYHSLIHQVRQHINDRLNHALPNYPLAGQIKALTIGMSDAISQSQWQIFKATGTVHLMVIAGLHIGLVTGFIFFLAQWLWRRSTNLCLWIPAHQVAALSSLAMAWIYSALAGFSIPTQRAMIMITVFMGMQLLRRTVPAWNGFCMGLLIVVVMNPLATLEAGFWLSFLAVALIIYGTSGRLHGGSHWQKLARIQVILGVGLVPITLLWFQQASLSGIIANAIAIPWVGFIVAPLSLLGVFLMLCWDGGSRIILIGAEKTMELFWPVLQWLATFPYATWQMAIANVWILLILLWGVILLLAPRGFPARWLGVQSILVFFLYKTATPQLGEVWITLLDVGQGLATVVQTQHHILVYDTGPKWSADFDTGAAVVVPYLRMLTIKHLDTLIISHEDNDHIGGAESLLQAFPAKNIFSSVPERLSPPLKKGAVAIGDGGFLSATATHCLAGINWHWDGIDFKFLYPPAHLLHLDNNSSCVLRISAGKQHVLLTGDIEKAAEEYLVKNHKDELPATLVVVPHHGSNTSSTADFVKAIHPKYAFFPFGYLNKYRFPKAEVLKRYQEIGAVMYDTVQFGAITLKLK